MTALADRIAELARTRADDAAFVCSDVKTSWADYHARSDAIAASLVERGFAPGDRIAVLLPDGPAVHAALVGCEKAGVIAVGIGPRAGFREIEHLLDRTAARALVSEPAHEGREVAAFLRSSGARSARTGVEWIGIDTLPSTGEPDRNRSLSPDDVFLLNSTSGTTGMPKVVVHDQRRWFAFHELALATGELSPTDVFMSAVPAPFGFGIWTSHVTPTLLGCPTVLCARFDADETLAAIERHRVTVLAAVTTQFVMLLESPNLDGRDLSSLRVLYTGGEAVPYERAAEFEERCGAAVLQFYGSNETGAVSGTNLRDDRDRRLRTAGRVVDRLQVRLFDEAGNDVTATGRGQPGCKGPTLSRGYWDDDAANAELVRGDGWMLLGDVVEIDAERTLRVVGRKDDFIIRGGKNISGPAVEAEVSTHPAVVIAAAVAMPDEVFGERVCVYVQLRPGESLDLEELIAHLRARDVSKENLPERLEQVPSMPRNSGGKVAKQQLRDDVRAKLRAE